MGSGRNREILAAITQDLPRYQEPLIVSEVIKRLPDPNSYYLYFVITNYSGFNLTFYKSFGLDGKNTWVLGVIKEC